MHVQGPRARPRASCAGATAGPDLRRRPRRQAPCWGHDRRQTSATRSLLCDGLELEHGWFCAVLGARRTRRRFVEAAPVPKNASDEWLWSGGCWTARRCGAAPPRAPTPPPAGSAPPASSGGNSSLRYTVAASHVSAHCSLLVSPRPPHGQPVLLHPGGHSRPPLWRSEPPAAARIDGALAAQVRRHYWRARQPVQPRQHREQRQRRPGRGDHRAGGNSRWAETTCSAGCAARSGSRACTHPSAAAMRAIERAQAVLTPPLRTLKQLRMPQPLAALGRTRLVAGSRRPIPPL